MISTKNLLRSAFVVFLLLAPILLHRFQTNGQTAPDQFFSIHQLQDQEFNGANYNFTPATYSPPSSQPPDLKHIGATGSVTQNLNREVLGFAPYWTLSSVKNYDFSYVSTVAYFGVDIDGNSGGLIQTNSGWTGWASTDLQTLVGAAHAKGDRVVLTVKLFDTLSNGGTQTLGGFLANGTSQQTSINQIISEVRNKGVDGVNVDFEPNDSSSATAGQKSAFATFLTNLTNQLRANVPGAEVTVDTLACAARGSSPCSTNSFFDPAALAATPIDAMMVMAYDFYSPSSSIIAPTAPLNGFPSTYWYDVAHTVSDYLTRAPASKIILGVPYYGIKLSTGNNSPNSPSVGNGSNPSYSQARNEIACVNATVTRDTIGDAARAYWLSDNSVSGCGTVYYTWRQIYFDDATSLSDKYDLVNANNLRGIGIWALGYDGGYYSDLVAPIKNKFGNFSCATSDSTPVYRLTNNLGDHLYTLSAAEKDNAVTHLGYRTEGLAFNAYCNPPADSTPVYRLVNGSGIHFYTTSVVERNNAIYSLGYAPEGVAFSAYNTAVGGSTAIYRLVNQAGNHLLTADPAERDAAQNFGYTLEGTAFNTFSSSPAGTAPVYRLVNRVGGHFYTVSTAEMDQIVAAFGYTTEGVGFNTFINSPAGSAPVYRLVNQAGNHLYTASTSERDSVTAYGYVLEGIAFQAYTNTPPGVSIVYRLANSRGDHFYTASTAERDAATAASYSLEGTAFWLPN